MRGNPDFAHAERPVDAADRITTDAVCATTSRLRCEVGPRPGKNPHRAVGTLGALARMDGEKRS